MNDDNYIVIKGWMINKLNLSGTELILFSIIHGFSQDGESRYTGGLRYLEKATGKSRPTIIDNLKRLVESGLIIRYVNEVNRVTFVEYSSLSGVKKLYSLGKETLLEGSKETLPEGSKETLPNNTNLYNLSKKKRESTDNVLDFWPTFDDFWSLTIHKTGKAEAKEYWFGKKKLKDGSKLSQKEKEHIMVHYPEYAASNDPNYITRPHHYIYRRVFEDEIRKSKSGSINKFNDTSRSAITGLI